LYIVYVHHGGKINLRANLSIIRLGLLIYIIILNLLREREGGKEELAKLLSTFNGEENEVSPWNVGVHF
jgi:hypothetical protein